MSYSATNVFLYFIHPINVDNSSSRCHFCKQLIFISFISQLPVFKTIMVPQLAWFYLVNSAGDFSFQITILYFLISEMRIHILSSFGFVSKLKKTTSQHKTKIRRYRYTPKKKRNKRGVSHPGTPI